MIQLKAVKIFFFFALIACFSTFRMEWNSQPSKPLLVVFSCFPSPLFFCWRKAVRVLRVRTEMCMIFFLKKKVAICLRTEPTFKVFVRLSCYFQVCVSTISMEKNVILAISSCANKQDIRHCFRHIGLSSDKSEMMGEIMTIPIWII